MCGAEVLPLSAHVPVKPEPHSPEALALLESRVVRAFEYGIDPVPSPCISICKMNEDRSLCIGCYRSLDEIRAWSAAQADARRNIWRSLLARAGLPATP
jgi:predicted Fe-S protein YdhL (DUF1289 family)